MACGTGGARAAHPAGTLVMCGWGVVIPCVQHVRRILVRMMMMVMMAVVKCLMEALVIANQTIEKGGGGVPETFRRDGGVVRLAPSGGGGMIHGSLPLAHHLCQQFLLDDFTLLFGRVHTPTVGRLYLAGLLHSQKPRKPTQDDHPYL